MFNLFALLRDDPLKPVTPLTNGAIKETLQQFAPLIDDCLLQLVDCRESSTLINHLLKGTPNSAIDWIQVRAVWGPHVRLDERDVLTPQVLWCVPGCVWRRAVLLQTCKMPGLLLQDVTVTLDNDWDNKHVVPCYHFIDMCNVLLQKSSLFQLLVFNTPDISQGSVVTQLRCCGIFSDSIITNFLLILTVK